MTQLEASAGSRVFTEQRAVSNASFFRLAVLGLVFTQRFAIPLGPEQQVPLVLPLALMWLAYGLYRGHLVVAGKPARAYSIALLALVGLTLVGIAATAAPSFFSLFFLVGLYAPGVARMAAGDALNVRAVHLCFVRTMTALACLAAALFALQFAGLPYRDWLFGFVPQAFVQEGYNTAYPLFWNSDVYRSNGVFFLEASFFSLFVAVAALMAVWYECRTWIVLVLVGGVAVSASGNGIIVLGLGLLFLLSAGRGGLLLRYVPVAVGFVAVLLVTPLGTLFLRRSTEVTSDNSSGSLRLVRPFSEVIPAVLSDPWALIFGNGPGSVTRYYDEVVQVKGLLAPVPLKLLYEYGVVGCVAFLALLLVILLNRKTAGPWVPGLLVAYFLVNAALLQATMALLVIFLLGIVRERAPAART